MAYTAANVCLRAVANCDPVWVSSVKAMPTVLLATPFIIFRIARGQLLIPNWTVVLLLVAGGTLAQLGGNVLFQWSLGIVGIALTVPLCLGAMILSGAVLGQVFLNETVSRRMACAIFTLLVAIFVLGFGARAANESVGNINSGDATSKAILVAGVIAVCVAGIAYCIFGGIIRHAKILGTPDSIVLGLVSFVGVIELGIFSLLRIGWSGIQATSADDLSTMMMAGLFNALAFWALTRALHLTGLVYINTLNACQSAMAAVAGVLIFREAMTVAMSVGVGLTVVGLVLMRETRGGTGSTKPPSNREDIELETRPADNPAVIAK